MGIRMSRVLLTGQQVTHINICLSKRSQAEKDRCCVMSVTESRERKRNVDGVSHLGFFWGAGYTPVFC